MLKYSKQDSTITNMSNNPLSAIVFLRNLKKDPKLAGMLKKEEVVAYMDALLRVFIETPLFGVFIYDVEQRKHAWVNKGYLIHGNYTAEEVLSNGKSFIDSVVHNEDFDAIHRAIHVQPSADGVLRSHYRKKNSKGGWDWFYMVGQIILETDRKPRLIFCFCVNLSKEGLIINQWESITRENSIIHHRMKTMCLTNREKEVIKLLAHGLTLKEIGERLNISFYTVDTHKKNLFRKLGKKSIPGLVAFAVDAGLN